MDDTVKNALKNDKIKFFKLYDILYQIFEYLYPILNDIRTIINEIETKGNEDKKKKKKKEKPVDNDIIFELHTILCCDSSFFGIPIEAFLYYMIDLKFVNREFSTNLLLHRLLTQSYQNSTTNDSDNIEIAKKDSIKKKEKNKKNKKVNQIENGISQITSFNYILNGIPESTELSFVNIPYFKNLLKKNHMVKWNGVASYTPSLKDVLFYFNSPSFIYISYTPFFFKFSKKDLNINLSNTRTGIFLDYPNKVEKLNEPGISQLVNSDEFMLFLSLQGINNICYQPFCSTLSNNELIFKSLLGKFS
jgi:hypothetical protein